MHTDSPMQTRCDMQMARRIDAVDFSLRQEQQRTMQALQAALGQAPATSARGPASTASNTDSKADSAAVKPAEFTEDTSTS